MRLWLEFLEKNYLNEHNYNKAYILIKIVKKVIVNVKKLK